MTSFNLKTSPHFDSLKIQAIHCLFESDERLLYFLFHHKKLELRESASELLKEARCFSRGEFLMVQVALDIWCGEGHVKLPELLSGLDDQNLLRVIRAIAKVREFIELAEALECLS